MDYFSRCFDIVLQSLLIGHYQTHRGQVFTLRKRRREDEEKGGGGELERLLTSYLHLSGARC
jgi:hypothetical protein